MKVKNSFIRKMTKETASILVESVLSVIKETDKAVLLKCEGDYNNVNEIWIPKSQIVSDEDEILYVRDVIRRLGFRHRADIKCIIYQNGKKRKENNCCYVMDNMLFIQMYELKKYEMLDDKTLRIDLIDVAPSKRYGIKNENK